jgi:hypothetical protein
MDGPGSPPGWHESLVPTDQPQGDSRGGPPKMRTARRIGGLAQGFYPAFVLGVSYPNVAASAQNAFFEATVSCANAGLADGNASVAML